MAFKRTQKRIKWSPFESTQCRCPPYQKLALKMKAAKRFQFHMMRQKGIPDYFARRRTPERVMYPTLLQCSIECVAASRPARQPASQPASQHPPRSSQGQAATHGQAGSQEGACQQPATKVPGSTWPGQGGQPQRIFIPCNRLLENSQATYYKE